jgi:putative heme-binding domain-containing protein
VDIKLGPDGSLYIADFYNRIIGHYEVPLDHPGRDRERGRIWRIVYRGPDGNSQPRPPRSDWTKATIAELTEDLGHPNLTVRTLAANQLVQRGGREVVDAVLAVQGPAGSTSQRVHGLWVLERLGRLDKQTLIEAATDETRDIRAHAMRILSERKELTAEQHAHLIAALKDKDAFVQRCATDALGRHADVENLRPLLDLRQAVDREDTHRLHTVRMALRDTLRLPSAWAKLPEPLSAADRSALADVSLGVPSAEAAGFLLEHFSNGARDTASEKNLAAVRHIARHGTKEATDKLVGLCRAVAKDRHTKFAYFRMIEEGTQERGTPITGELREWGATLVEDSFTNDDPITRSEAIRLAGSLHLESTSEKLSGFASDPNGLEASRVAALNSLIAIDAPKYTPLAGRILADAHEPVSMREHAAQLLGQLGNKEAHTQLMSALPLAPARLQIVIAAHLAGNQAGGEKLLEAVAAGKASARLLQERIVEIRLANANVPTLKQRLAKLTEGLPPADQRLQELFKQRKIGFTAAKVDPSVGAKVFEKSCANCHQLGGKGAKIGPQLDGIGIRGIDRLLEDILDPNRNVDQAFRATTLARKNGETITGLLLREEGEVLVMADAQGKEVRVPKNTVEERSVSQLSPMPANWADQIPEADFYHLLAYLLEQRATKGGK